MPAFPAWRGIAAAALDAPADPACLSDIAEEIPIAFAYGGVAHAVMMATPADLDDFAVGFSIAEGIAARADDIRRIDIAEAADGLELDITLQPAALHAFLARRRTRALRGHTSCGLCGVEDLGQLPAVTGMAPSGGAMVRVSAIRAALAALRDFQPLSRRTRAAHAAAWADPHGRILLAREDVGRHNALDKLVGACLRGGVDVAAGFALVTSRCSFEMVQKAVAAGMPALVAVSAPTAMAVRHARAAGLTLVARAGAEDARIYAGPERIAP